MQITEKENERKLKVKRAKTNLAVLSTCWMEVFGLLNLKRHSKSPTCGTKITDRHHYYNLLKLNFDAQAFLILIPEIFASFFVADRTSIVDVRHFAWDFSKFPYIGPVSDPSPSHLQLPPFLLDFSSAQGIADLWRRSTFLSKTGSQENSVPGYLKISEHWPSSTSHCPATQGVSTNTGMGSC